MKTKMITLAMCATTFMSFAQWTYKNVNSDFDGTFKKAYTQINNNGFLGMEKDDKPFLFLYGTYFCDDTAYVDLVFHVNGNKKLYSLYVTKSTDSHYYYFEKDIWTEEFTKDFKDASKCYIRVNQSHCTKDYYQFIMTNSSAAYNFINE